MSAAPPYVAVGLASPAALRLLDRIPLRPGQSFLLATARSHLQKVALSALERPDVADVIALDEPTIAHSEDGLRFQEYVLAGRIEDGWAATADLAQPLRFKPEERALRWTRAYSVLRWLALNGLADVRLVNPEGIRPGHVGPLLDEFVDRHKGRRAVVMGNGPSLKHIDMTRLGDEITFGSNRVYLGFSEWGFAVNYWAIEDRLQIEAYGRDYHDNLPENVIKFVPTDYAEVFRPANSVLFPLLYADGARYPDGLTYPAFSATPKALRHGFTVTYSLIELAALMGCDPIILVGVDHDYGLAPGQIAVAGSGGAGLWSASHSSGATHFSDQYAAETRRFVRPRPINAEIAYAAAAQWARAQGRTLLNATPGTKLDVIETVDFRRLF